MDKHLAIKLIKLFNLYIEFNISYLSISISIYQYYIKYHFN